MLEEIKSLTKSIKSPQVDLTKIDNLAERIETDISATAELTEQLTEAIQQTRQPIINERKITIDIVAKETIFLFISIIVIISGLST